MKHFLIKYRHTNGSAEEWHQAIRGFIAALDSDPAVKGRIAYRCMKNRNGSDYYHLAVPQDEDANRVLSDQAFFKRYQQQTRAAAGGEVEVVPLEILAETELHV